MGRTAAGVTPASRGRGSHRLAGFALAIVVALAAWVAVDLWGPRHTDIRVFDADRVARLDTEMWRSYYDRRPAPLFFQLAQLLRSQFGFPRVRSYVVAGYAARAAFVFKRGASRAEYERALPDLIRYYGAIRAVSTTPFDVRRTAEFELEWWIVHRQRATGKPGDLETALAVAAAELYRVPEARMAEYARRRAAAMEVRDTRAAQGGVRESDWARIADELQVSWKSLRENVH